MELLGKEIIIKRTACKVRESPSVGTRASSLCQDMESSVADQIKAIKIVSVYQCHRKTPVRDS
jgi:hypothetical protein